MGKRTFITLGAQSIIERNRVIAQIFIKGDVWKTLWDGELYKVRNTDVHGKVVLDRLKDGQPYIMWPHESSPDDWVREIS